MKGYQEFLFVGILIQLRAQQDEERKELSELRNEIKSQLQLDKDVSPSTVFFYYFFKSKHPRLYKVAKTLQYVITQSLNVLADHIVWQKI